MNIDAFNKNKLFAFTLQRRSENLNPGSCTSIK